MGQTLACPAQIHATDLRQTHISKPASCTEAQSGNKKGKERKKGEKSWEFLPFFALFAFFVSASSLAMRPDCEDVS
jgi:hypothetical protein